MSGSPPREVVVFNAALRLPAGRRERFVREACGGDAGMSERLAALLRAHEQAGSFLQTSAPASSGFMAADRKVDRMGVTRLGGTGGEQISGQVGRYKLLREIGEGGYAVVWLAEQEEPVRRTVALKILKPGMDTRRVIARFEAERQALAMMDHPNIAKVLDAGATRTGRPFFVMEWVRGIRITDYCDRNALSPPQRLELFIQVCRAIQHAHQKGVIHRDIKPSNILVMIHDGAAVPKVIDFGIAKAIEGRLTDQTLFTPSDHFIGTPAYMSPEQAALMSLDVDTRSDLYSLGVLLYELVTGTTPFDPRELMASGLESMRRTLRQTEPAAPSTRLAMLGAPALTLAAQRRRVEGPRLLQFVRGDLDLITMKCLEKDRARRYETAGDLAADVERFLAHEPIVARPASNLYRLQRLIRRNRVAVTAAGVVVAALLLGLGLSTWQFLEKSRAEQEQSRLRQQAQRAQAEEARSRLRAEAQELRARRMAYASDMNLLQQALAADDLGRAQELLYRQQPLPGKPDLRGWEWRYFWQFCQTDAAFTLCQRSNSILSVSFSSNGALLAAGTYPEHEITVWDLAKRRMIYRRSLPGGGPCRLAFSPVAPILAFSDGANDRKHIVLWDSDSKTESRRLPLAGALREMAFTRDGRLFTATAGRSNNLTLWDTASGRVLRQSTARFPTYEMGRILDVTGDGTAIAYAVQASHSVRVIVGDDRAAPAFRVADEITTAVGLSNDGRTLLTGAGYAEGAIKLWDVQTRQSVGTLEGHRGWVSCLKFLPDGKTLASASADRTVRLWDFATRRTIRTLRGQKGEVWAMDVSPDGRWLAGGGKDGTVLLWDLAAAETRPPQYRKLSSSGAWAPSPDGRWLGVLDHRRVRLYEAATLRLVRELPPPMTNLTALAFSPDLRRLVATDGQGNLRAWDLQENQPVKDLPPQPREVSRGAIFLDQGRSVLTFGGNGFRQREVSTGNILRQWPADPEPVSWVARPAANLLAVGWENGALECIPLAAPQQRRRFAGQSRIRAVDLSPDGKTLAAASEQGTLELWDTQTGTHQALLRGVLLGYHSVAFSPDGDRLIGGSNGRQAMNIWDVQAHMEVATLPGEGSCFVNAAFTPDGNTIGAANWKGELHLWTAPTWEQIAAAEASPLPLRPPSP